MYQDSFWYCAGAHSLKHVFSQFLIITAGAPYSNFTNLQRDHEVVKNFPDPQTRKMKSTPAPIRSSAP